MIPKGGYLNQRSTRSWWTVDRSGPFGVDLSTYIHHVGMLVFERDKANTGTHFLAIHHVGILVL